MKAHCGGRAVNKTPARTVIPMGINRGNANLPDFPQNAPCPHSDDQAMARLRAEFPGWRFIVSDRRRWWALCGPLPADRLNEVDAVHADTPSELHTALAKVTGNRETQ